MLIILTYFVESPFLYVSSFFDFPPSYFRYNHLIFWKRQELMHLFFNRPRSKGRSPEGLNYLFTGHLNAYREENLLRSMKSQGADYWRMLLSAMSEITRRNEVSKYKTGALIRAAIPKVNNFTAFSRSMTPLVMPASSFIPQIRQITATITTNKITPGITSQIVRSWRMWLSFTLNDDNFEFSISILFIFISTIMQTLYQFFLSTWFLNFNGWV